MLSVLLIWVYISFVCYVNGYILLKILKRFFGLQTDDGNDFSLVSIAGLCLVTSISGYLNFFINIGVFANVLIFGYSILFVLFDKQCFTSLFTVRFANELHKYKLWLILIAGVIFLLILARTANEVRIADSGGYHVPIIHIIENYKIIPGLANLNLRFGLNSSWFLSNAFFSFHFLDIQSFHVLNGWLLLVFLSFLYRNVLRALVKGFDIYSYFSFTCALVFSWFFHWQLSSPSPDLPANVLVAVCFLLFIKKIQEDSLRSLDQSSILIILFCFVSITIKLSSIPVLLILSAVMFFQFRVNTARIVLGTLIIALFFVSYWLVGNVLLTGYLIYPAGLLKNLFDFDWKVPASSVELINKCVIAHVRPVDNFKDVFFEWKMWVPDWFGRGDIIEKVIYISLAIMPLIAFIVTLLFKKIFFYNKRIYIYSILTFVFAYAGVLLWFITSPTLRFGLSFICIALSYAFLPFFILFRKKVFDEQKFSIAAVFLVSTTLLVVALSKQPPVLLQKQYPTVITDTYSMDGKVFYYPTKDEREVYGIKGFWVECFDSQFPCSYKNGTIEARGTNFQEGFRSKK